MRVYELLPPSTLHSMRRSLTYLWHQHNGDPEAVTAAMLAAYPSAQCRCSVLELVADRLKPVNGPRLIDDAPCYHEHDLHAKGRASGWQRVDFHQATADGTMAVDELADARPMMDSPDREARQCLNLLTAELDTLADQARLTPRERVFLTMRLRDGLAFAVIGRLFHVSAGTVGSTVYRALRRILRADTSRAAEVAVLLETFGVDGANILIEKHPAHCLNSRQLSVYTIETETVRP